MHRKIRTCITNNKRLFYSSFDATQEVNNLISRLGKHDGMKSCSEVFCVDDIQLKAANVCFGRHVIVVRSDNRPPTMYAPKFT